MDPHGHSKRSPTDTDTNTETNTDTNTETDMKSFECYIRRLKSVMARMDRRFHVSYNGNYYYDYCAKTLQYVSSVFKHRSSTHLRTTVTCSHKRGLKSMLSLSEILVQYESRHDAV